MSRPAPREPREQGVVRRAAQPHVRHVSHVSRGGQVRERAVCRVSQLVKSLTTWAPRRGRGVYFDGWLTWKCDSLST